MKNALCKTSAQNNQSGMALLTVMLFSAALVVLAAGLYFLSTSQAISARRHIRLEKAFFLAEAGVERAKAELSAIGDSANIPANGILTNIGHSVNFGGGEYSVRAFNSTNNIIAIWSTGIFQNVERVLEVGVTLSSALHPMLNADGAIGVYGTNVQIAIGGSSLVDGRDYAVPADFFCSGAGCLGTLTTNPATAGIFSSSTSTVVTVSGSAVVEGNPTMNIGAEGLHTYEDLARLTDHFINNATIIVPGGNITGNQTIGTRENPEIAIITGDTKITGNVDGAGILIISGEVEVDLTGTFHYEGIIILAGDRSKLDDRGTASLFGSVLAIGEDAHIKPHGSPQIYYSTEALANLVNLPMPPGKLSVMYWRHAK